jgi:ribosomal protein S18 acetylase RimI-like enzyme
MKIRAAVPEDARQIAEVHLETWKSAYSGIISKDYLDSLSLEKRKSRWDEILSSQKETETNIVAEIENRIVGFVSAGPNRTAESEYGSEIYALYIHPNFQNKGVGTSLLRRAHIELRGKMFLNSVVWVLKDNPSRIFYERMGGRKIEESSIRIGEQDLDEVAYCWDSI